MESNLRPCILTIPAELPFVDALAAGILEQVGGEPLALAACTVLLPSRRACRSLREAFLRISGGSPQLLPRMTPLGDIDADELSIGVEDLSVGGAALDLPPAFSPLRRQLLLTQAILRTGTTERHDQAARLAGELGRLRDQMIAEGLGFDRLDGLVPEDHARHWQITLDFLKVLREVWPLFEAAEGAVDAATRNRLVLEAQAALWREKPPRSPVIAAGHTNVGTAAAGLLHVVARLPQGRVVLPGLDLGMDDLCWAALDDAHPQYELARLLDALEATRDDVLVWRCARPIPAAPAARTRLLAEALRPAATSEAWRDLDEVGEDALEGLSRIDCPTPQEEAGVIALLMREALETPAKTVALVTPDRSLARRVATALERWGIAVDDSGGRPLGDTAVGTFLRLAADCALADAEPVRLLTLLKHPLAAGGLDPARFRARARELERFVLRGPRPGAGFAGLRAALSAADYVPEGLGAWFARLEAVLGPWTAAMTDGTDRPLAEWIDLHCLTVETLAEGNREPGPQRLWRHEDGEAAAHFLNELKRAAEGFPPVPGALYPPLFEALLSTAPAVRPRYGLHPRLSILGLLEARLQRADLVILGGLNEGTWPPDPGADPWLSRPMRKALGLPSPERMVGLAAHDFAQLANAREAVLTRAERVEGTPTVPSRWLLRLDAVLDGLDLSGRIDRDAERWLAWAETLDRPASMRAAAPPEPRPPVAARPRRLSVTEVETWMRDPYAIYARHVLRLKALEPIAADPGASDRGQFIHAALDGFVKAWPDVLPPDAVDRLKELGREAFGDHLARPDVWAFWWPRFERICAWFVEHEARRRETARTVAAEVRGTLVLDGPAGPFTLVGKADRVDRLDGGGLAIIDYKTGTPPSGTEVALGFAPQLPLEAAMAAAGGFEGLAAEPVAELAFWRLSGGEPAGEEKPVAGDAADLAEQARAGLLALIEAFDDPATPYRALPRPDRAPRFSDYAQLARIQEWSAGPGEGGE